MSAGRPELPAHRPRAGFTLVEVLVSLGLVSMLTLALLVSYSFTLRGDVSLSNYTEMNTQARALLEALGRDLRSATDVVDFTASTLTLTVPTTPSASATQSVVWTYDSVAGTFSRQAASTTKIYARNLSTFTFNYRNGLGVVTTSLVEVKQVQVSLRLLRTVVSATTSEYVISAQFTMRAKSTAH